MAPVGIAGPVNLANGAACNFIPVTGADMTIRRAISVIMFLVIVGEAWALYDLVRICDQRSGLRTLSLAVQSLLREGSTLRVADKVKFARELSQQGIYCRYYGGGKEPTASRSDIRCFEDKTSGQPSIVHFYADFSFEHDAIVKVEEGVRKVFDYETREQQ